MAYAVLNIERDKPRQTVLLDYAKDIDSVPTAEYPVGTVAMTANGASKFVLSPSKEWVGDTGNADKVNYTVHYYLSSTTSSVKADKVETKYSVGDVVTETAPDIANLTKADPTTAKLTLTSTASSNIFTFYYNQIAAEYTVNYYLKDTTSAVASATTVSSGVYVGDSVTVNASSIDGYTAVEPTSKTITLKDGENAVNFYYTQD